MPRPVSLTDEFVYRIAPDGKSAQAALDLVRRGAFRDPEMSADGTRLDASCQGSEPRPYNVRVDLSNPDSPRTGCTCSSFKHPCKHALGLLFLAVRSPGAFEGGSPAPPKGRQERGQLIDAAVREAPREEKQAPADVGEALFQAIRESPEDDAPRLVYADWLDEHGGPAEQARAEFIRVQVELARTPEKTPRHRELSAREKALWKAHKAGWLENLPPHLRARKTVRFRRGFYDEIHLTPASWAAHGDELFARNPIYRLRLSGRVDRHQAGRLAVIPHLARVRVLDLTRCSFHEPVKTFQVLFNTPFLSGLRQLILNGCGLSTQALGVLVGSPVLDRLHGLDLADNGFGPRAPEMLAESAHVANLKELSLANNPLGESGAKALAASPHLKGLARLDLRGVELGERSKSALRMRFGERVLLD